MHQSEWIDAAKRVPVGQKRRVRHGGERTAAMDVWNNEDSWSAYCHRCHTSAKVYKQFLQKVDTSVPVFRRYWDHSRSVTLQELAEKHPEKHKATVVLLQTKGVSTAILERYKPMYCLTDDRLVFKFDGVYLGRDCTGRSEAKWLKYYHHEPKQYVYLQGTKAFDSYEPIVACEDLFSCAKVRHYTGYSALCLLGTGSEDSKFRFLLQEPRKLLIATDGDQAGWDSARELKARCEVLGIPYKVLNVPDGLDPKDMSPIELQELVNAGY